MANKDEGTGCGCLIVLALLGIGGYKVYNWCVANPQSVSNGLSLAVKTLIGLVILIVLYFVVRRRWLYRQRIIRWEKTDLRDWLQNNPLDDTVSRSKDLAATLNRALNEMESQLTEAQRELSAFHNEELKLEGENDK